MAPVAIDPRIIGVAPPRKDILGLPESARTRLEKTGIDLIEGYLYRQSRPLYLDDVYKIRNHDRAHVDPGTRATPEKKALLSATKEVPKNLTDQQKDELSLLLAERSVVFFRDQDISLQQQKALGEYFGEIEVFPQLPQAPLVPGVSVIWPALQATENPASFRRPRGASRWRTDLVHEKQRLIVTHLHNDNVPTFGGATLWASGYAACEKLSPSFRKFTESKTAIYPSAQPYLVGIQKPGHNMLSGSIPLSMSTRLRGGRHSG